MLDEMDEKFKKLSNLDSVPPQIDFNKEEVWRAIEFKLDKRKKDFRINYKWFWLPALLLLGGASWYLINSNTKESQSKPATIASTKAVEKIDVIQPAREIQKVTVAATITETANTKSILQNYIPQQNALEVDSIIPSTEEKFEPVHIADIYTEEKSPMHVSDELKTETKRDRRFYFKQYLNVESFNHHLDRERSYMAIVPKDSADFFTNTNPDTIANGKLMYYYRTGELYEIDVYEDGTLVSRKKYFKNGKKMLIEKIFSQQSEGIHPGNMPRGATTIGSNGFKKAATGDQSFPFVNNYFSEVIFARDPSGETMVKGGNGNYIEYFPNGNIMLTGEYKDGVPKGKWIGYYENGNKMYEANYNLAYVWIVENIFDPNGNSLVTNGRGRCVLYYPNGQVQFSGNYVEGKLDGEVLSYYSNGQLKSKSYYEGSKLTGIYTSYYQNGKTYNSGYFRQHNKTGEWNWYDSNGQIIRTVIYK